MNHNRKMFPDQPRGPGNPEWLLTPREVAKLNDTQIREMVTSLYEDDEKASMNSLYGACNHAGV